MTWWIANPGECTGCGKTLYSHESRKRKRCSACGPARIPTRQVNLDQPSSRAHGYCTELKGGTKMRLGIDHRGRLFWHRDGERWYADPEDNELMELQSILLDAKPRGGSFIVGNGTVRYTTYSGQKEPDYVKLWFDPMKADWIHPRRLNDPLTEREKVDTEEFIRRLSS